MDLQRDPTWPPSTETLEELCEQGFVQKTFVRLAPARRLKILDAALAAAAEHGPEHLNIKVVAKLADVPVGSLYQYFGERDALVRLTCILVTQRLSDVLAIATSSIATLPLAQSLGIYLEKSIIWCKKEPALTRIYVTAAYNVAFRGPTSGDADTSIVEAVAGTVQQVSRGLVKAASRRGELRSDVDLEQACRIINILCIAMIDAALLPGLNAYYRLFDTRHSQSRMIKAAVALTCRGILTPETSPSTKPKRSSRRTQVGKSH